MDLPRKVYAIQHNVTKRIYIGSSKNVDKRYVQHMRSLRAGKHIVGDMQDDFNRYGEDYSLFILDEITEFKDRKKEYEWMQRYNTFTRGIGYNYNDGAKDKICSINTPPYKNGVPTQSDSEIPMRDKYKKDIIKLLNECEDISLMDLICHLLKKRAEQRSKQ